MIEVLPRSEAVALGHVYEFEAALPTLTARSSLDPVGLPAPFAARRGRHRRELPRGYHHDPVLVSADRVDDAIAALRSLRELEISGRATPAVTTLPGPAICRPR